MCEMRSVFPVEGERDSVDRGEVVFTPLREVSDPSRECRRSAMNIQRLPMELILSTQISHQMQGVMQCCLIY